ncbi:hypothetical protein [Achromobacter sp. UMC46]|uniref:hypothetical protein n=1 Tax=Achromobacter sp. UMC46 TaxID=1862319 RepID=UPI001601D4AE|nr:hypothetical protein [Achromobacter sp. UMC46]MBB1592476.1 hypothetical protein [Achromobacter sp. UMC46]
MEGSDAGRWSFQVPAGQPPGVRALCGLAIAVAAACVLTAASWGGPAWAAGAVIALLLVLFLLVPAGLLHSARSSLSPVSAIRTATGVGRWQVRRPQGWQDAVLLNQQRGLRWLTLTLQPLPTGSTAFTNRTITLTVWQRTLRPESWRRLCLLTGTARRTQPAARPQEAS